MSVVSVEKLQKALSYMAETDELFSQLRGELKDAEYVAKRKRAHVILTETGTAQQKTAKSEIDPDVIAAEKRITEKLVEVEKIRGKRQTADKIIEVWRSENANRRVGNV